MQESVGDGETVGVGPESGRASGCARESERPRLLLQDPSPACPPLTCQERTPRPPGLAQCRSSPSMPRGGVAGQRPRQALASPEAAGSRSAQSGTCPGPQLQPYKAAPGS